MSDSPLNSARQHRRSTSAHSLWAKAAPMVWLNAAGLAVCLVMIVGLLALILYQGMTTFWPVPLVRVTTVDGDVIMGEVTRTSDYELTFGTTTLLPEKSAEAARALLMSSVFADLQASSIGALSERLAERLPLVRQSVHAYLESMLAPSGELSEDAKELLSAIDGEIERSRKTLTADFIKSIRTCRDSESLRSQWQAWRQAEQEWVELEDPVLLRDVIVEDKELLTSVFSRHALVALSDHIRVSVKRRLFRTGNYELTNEHFRWVSEFQVDSAGDELPRWGILLERLEWGRFYGEPVALEVDGEPTETQPAAIWRTFQELHPAIRQRWRTRRRLEKHDVGLIHRAIEKERLGLRRIELDFGRDSSQWRTAEQAFRKRKAELDRQFARVTQEIAKLDRENDRYHLVMRIADGREANIAIADIVRAYPPNQLSTFGKLGIYGSRWWEFLSDEPRQANNEGGVFPAIWGTVVMTLLMSIAVVPFGVLAALYLREYAKAGLLVSIVRISVNNLAGVPSIVFGVFGLGFFCYIVGASIDQLLFAERLPSPTFGTGGLMWASLTLSLLTLPVVIVATEEALAAVPRSMREGSLACGATKWQTIRRIVLPRALPGIMTGLILAMARGAGEVAPLMLVGAVKLAPELPLDGVFPYLHFERSFMHLGFHVYDLGFQSQNSEAAKPMVYTTTLLLITLIAAMNLLAIWLRTRLRRRFEFGKF